MKVIFLDIDGVLNHQEWYQKRLDLVDQNEISSHYPFYEFDPGSVELLNYIIDRTWAKVVVSSTWRLGRRPQDLQEILDRVGFTGEVIDTTPYMRAPKINGEPAGYTIPRGCEIDWWLEKKGDFQRVNWSRERQQEYIDKAKVKNYVILDDDSDMLLNQREHFVKTYTMHGLTKERADMAIEILNKSLIELYYQSY